MKLKMKRLDLNTITVLGKMWSRINDVSWHLKYVFLFSSGAR